MPAAYVVFLKEAVHDEEELARYQAAVGGTFAGHPVEFLATYGEQEMLEGAPVDGVVLLKFPDLDAARRWYRSPEYQAAASHRFKGATYRAVIVAGRD
ncbi:DUF1330 domain-containing protein [Mitsuaria sp. GD03876]|uniref:DUF1330 domain-containing protein n=1 Tax=Mitsuaria sp. GD03876 TaxID=2975399 RepID=UPI00244D4E05|nr:DUF1330 domain-containing protein [Mitsuaria sp. GD03876]MDH0864393.1 DUF1330 domain-containing protein [Mitsuaria sp. GD03876]